tara:strand:- start:736 stop:924 length:189 start_codon:yes stop_codon:yes gene_type:complete
MPKQETNTSLKAENARLNKRIALLQNTIGLIRQEVGRITVPRDYVDDLKQNIMIIDRIIDRT